MKKYLFLFSLLLLPFLWNCSGEDRSGEQPFAPVLSSPEAIPMGDSCLLRGYVVSSPNSSLTACGFYYGNDSIKKELTCSNIDFTFEDVTDSLGAGRFYAVSYAQNGIGKTLSDTLWFELIP